ncbi:hypothetical protein MSPP1_001683 [Malassezia sp. CBS 17886]|nr:hypothetical protein MSPP1_001683 [Malassezia sp. CBS 17886]
MHKVAKGPETSEAFHDPVMDVAFSVLDREARAVEYVARNLRTCAASHLGFRQAVALALQHTNSAPGQAGGKLIVVGVGKSGIIARKIASMLQSLGTQAVFLHPTESLHGDLGILCPGSDVVLALSFSGNSSEMTTFMALPAVQRCARIAMSGNRESALVHLADAWLDCSVPHVGASEQPGGSEAWHHIPAPTASTTAMLALGDAFVTAVTNAKGVDKATFVNNHPGGSLGIMFTMEMDRGG